MVINYLFHWAGRILIEQVFMLLPLKYQTLIILYLQCLFWNEILYMLMAKSHRS